jgi:hypothetical protein
VRIFQAALAECIKETVSVTSYRCMMNLMIKDYTWTDGYFTQYLDLLNLRFLEMNREKRVKNLSVIAKRLVEQGKEYQEVKNEVFEAARENNCLVNDIRFKLDYPDYIDW